MEKAKKERKDHTEIPETKRTGRQDDRRKKQRTRTQAIHQPGEPTPQKTNQNKKMLIADSNRKYISPHLDTEKSEWAVMGGIYTEDELHDVLDSGEHDDMIRQQEIVVDLLGTNDIRGSKGRTEKVAAKSLQTC